MRILMPFWSADERTTEQLFERYYPQIKAIAERVEEFHIAYTGGEINPDEWKASLTFHRFKLPYHLIRRYPVLRWQLSLGSICRQLENIQVDIIYSLSGFWYQAVAKKLSAIKDVPYIVRLRADHITEQKIQFGEGIKDILYTRLQTRSLRTSDLIIPISSDIRNKALEWGVDPKKITEPIPLGVDTLLFKPMSTEKPEGYDLVIGYAGRINPVKRIDKLVEVVKDLPNVLLLIVGNWQISRFKLPNNVKYLGVFKHRDMVRFYSMIDVTALTSAVEAFPNVILESYACGTPVLCTPEAFPSPDLKLFGSVCRLELLKEQILSLTKNREFLDNAGLEARKYIQEQFTWENYGKKIVDELQTVKTKD